MSTKKLAVTSVMVASLVAGLANAGDEKDMADKTKHGHAATHDLGSSSRVKADWVDALDIKDSDKAEEIREIQASYWEDKKELQEKMSDLEQKKDKKLKKVLSQEEMDQLKAMSEDTQLQ